MPCNIELKINSKTLTSPYIIKNGIGKDESINFDNIVDYILELDQKTRQSLAEHLRSASTQSFSEEDLKNHNFISNTNLNDLKTIYPNLNNYNIPNDFTYNFTILRNINIIGYGKNYDNRFISSKGEEIFIVNNQYQADKLFRYIAAKNAINEKIDKNSFKDDSLNDFKDDLNIIAKHFNKNIENLLNDYLINVTSYTNITQNEKTYNTKLILNTVLTKLVRTLFETKNKSDLQMSLEQVKLRKKDTDNFNWKINYRDFFKILYNYFPNEIEYKFNIQSNQDNKENIVIDKLSELSIEDLNAFIKDLFKTDINLNKATITNKTKPIKETNKIEKILLSDKQIETFYKENFAKEVIKEYPKFEDLVNKRNENDLKKLLDPITYEIQSNGKKYKVYYEIIHNKLELFYNKEVESKFNYIINLNIDYTKPVGEIYNFGYEKQSLFEFKERYKGFYIYKYNDGNNVKYAVSRSIISPYSYMKEFENEIICKAFIDGNNDTIKECGLWSIKQYEGTPRTCSIEMKNIKVNQIITTLDYKLPTDFNYNSLPSEIQSIFNYSVQEFHKNFNLIKNIQLLDSPEKIACFIIETYHLYDPKKYDNYNDYLYKNDVQNIITKINESKTISYLVENINHKSKICQLIPLTYKGKNLSESGEFEIIQNETETIQDLLNVNFEELIKFFKNKFGITINSLSTSELETFSKKNNLDLEKKLNTVKAFVYNGEIYLHTSNSDYKDLFHELAHIVLGVIKIKDPNSYNKLITNKLKEIKNNKLTYTSYNTYLNKYKHYANRDVIEEMIADSIAEKMYNSNYITKDNIEDNLMQQFQNITKIFTSNDHNNNLGFANYINDFLKNKNQKNQIIKNMQISDYIQRQIANNNIKENC